MTLEDLFNMLAVGELTNLSLADGGVIKASAFVKLTRYVNEALLKLYSRFTLKENDVLVLLYDHITFYHLIPRFSLNYVPDSEADDEPIRYILDLPNEKFDEDILRVTSVFDQKGVQLPLNDDSHPFSLFTPQVKTLQVPNACSDVCLNVRYLQRHRTIQGELNERIECPDVLLPALTSYIAYKVFSHMNSADSSAKAQEFATTYEAVCNEVSGLDLVGSSISQTNTRFDRGGWA